MTEVANSLGDPAVASYWKSYNHYDPNLIKLDFFKDTTLTAEEKIDGSQFSFAKLPDQWGTARLVFRSKNKQIPFTSSDHMFSKPIRHLYKVGAFSIIPKNVVFRCEVLNTNRHNKLTYDTVPTSNMVMFGAENLATGKSVPRSVWSVIAQELGIDTVSHLGYIDTRGRTPAEVIDIASKWIGSKSQFGSTYIEGVVLKRETNWVLNQDGTPVYAKLVASEFKEIMKAPTGTTKVNRHTEIISRLVEMVQLDAIYSKAVQHLTEDGEISSSNKDIALIIKKVVKDLGEEFEGVAKDVLWKWARPQVTGAVVKGVAPWYTKRLERQMLGENVDVVDAEVVGESTGDSVQGDEPSGSGEDPVAI